MIGEPPAGKPFKIIFMGAGASGIDFLHHATREFASDPGVEFVCYEKNHDIGGTWLENRYPGCACDVPSAAYQFTWRPNPDWSMYYSPSKEIWEYFKNVVDEEGMMKYIRLKTAVSKAVWQEDKSKWVIHLVERNANDEVVKEWDEECDMFLNGAGVLKYV
jgi:cation diffusion facilitator CzcD-associated flavoprotein CzcO